MTIGFSTLMYMLQIIMFGAYLQLCCAISSSYYQLCVYLQYISYTITAPRAFETNRKAWLTRIVQRTPARLYRLIKSCGFAIGKTMFCSKASEPGLCVFTLLFGGEALGFFHFVHLWHVSDAVPGFLRRLWIRGI